MGILEAILQYEENSRKKLAVREIMFCSKKFSKLYGDVMPYNVVEQIVHDEWEEIKYLFKLINYSGPPPSYLSVAVSAMALKYRPQGNYHMSDDANRLWFITFSELLMKLARQAESSGHNSADSMVFHSSYETFVGENDRMVKDPIITGFEELNKKLNHGGFNQQSKQPTSYTKSTPPFTKREHIPRNNFSFEIHWMWLVVIIPIVFIGAIVFMLIFSDNGGGATVVRAQPEQPIQDHLQDTNLSLQDGNTLIKNDALAVSYHSETEEVDSSNDILQNNRDVVTSLSKPNSILQSHANSEETSVEPQNFNSTQNPRENQIFQIPERWDFLAETGTGYFVYATTTEGTAQHFRSYFKIEMDDGREEFGVGAVSKEECASYMKELTLAPVTPAGILSEREVISVLPTENTIAGIMVRHLCSLKNERSEVPADNPNRHYNDEEEHDLYFYEQGKDLE